MYIQWFPGHMYKAKQEIANRLKDIDLVIEVLDARLPASTLSPLLESLTLDKVKLKLLNKSDLSDSQVTSEWLAYLDGQHKTESLAITSNHSHKNKMIIDKARQLVPQRKGMDKPLRIMICGVPNVGKSSLINNLLDRKVAKTGNEAGVTKMQQRLVLENDVWLYDTPGMLWQKIAIPESGYRLAAAGSVGRNAYNDEEVALHLLNYLRNNYATQLAIRYSLDVDIVSDNYVSEEELLSALAKKRGAILAKGYVDYQKISEIIIQDFRTGRMGQISLEKPKEWLQWKDLADQKEEEKQRLKEERLRLKVSKKK